MKIGWKTRGWVRSALVMVSNCEIADCRLQIGQCKRHRRLNAILSEILGAGLDLGGSYFRSLRRLDVRRAHLAIIGSISPLAQPGHFCWDLAKFNFCVRKAAHVTEYAILALLLCRAVFRGTNLTWSRPALFASVWIACVLMAAGDEFRQSFVQSRGASPWDVMIDSAGAIFGLLIYSRFARGKSGESK